MDLASVPEIGPELLDLLDQPTTLARRSEARQTVLNWGHTLRVARTIFAPCQGGLAVRDHPSLEQHRRVVRYAFGAGPVSLRRIPMRLFGFNYCRRCLDPPIPEAPATADESHAALCAVRLGEWMPTWIPTHMYCQKCRNLNAPRPPPAPVPAPPHNKLCIVRTQYGFDRLQYDRYNYYEYRCDVKECAVHARPCPVHSSSPCRFCPRCQCREGCHHCVECNGVQCEHATLHHVLKQEELCRTTLEAQYNVERGLVELLMSTRDDVERQSRPGAQSATMDPTDSMRWMFTNLHLSEFQLGNRVWYWAIHQKNGDTVMNVLLMLLQYQTRIVPSWIMTPSIVQELFSAIKSERAQKLDNIGAISELVMKLLEASELKSEEAQLHATTRTIREAVQMQAVHQGIQKLTHEMVELEAALLRRVEQFNPAAQRLANEDEICELMRLQIYL